MAKIGNAAAKRQAKVREAKKALNEAKDIRDDTNRRIETMRESIASLTEQAAKNVKTAQNRLDRARKMAADNVVKAREAKMVVIRGDDMPSIQVITRRGRPRKIVQVENAPPAPEKKRRGRPRKNPN